MLLFDINKFADNFRNADISAFDYFFPIYRTPLHMGDSQKVTSDDVHEHPLIKLFKFIRFHLIGPSRDVGTALQGKRALKNMITFFFKADRNTLADKQV